MDHLPGDDIAQSWLYASLSDYVVASPKATQVSVQRPWDATELASVPLSSVDDVRMAYQTARVAQRLWQNRGVRERAAVLSRVHDYVLNKRDEVMDVIQAETGKARRFAFEEVFDVANVARYYARVAPGLLRPRRHRSLTPGLGTTHELRTPKGVVGVISPWNYPFSLAVGDALAALVAGNAVLVKADPHTPLSALWAARMFAHVGLPEGVFQVLVGDGESVGAAVVDCVDYVAFTGSTTTGRSVAQRAGERLVGCSLELGGKNRLYVADDVNIEIAAKGAARACFANAGQLCIAPERVLVHHTIADQFIPAFVRAVRNLSVGAGRDYSIEVGSLTTEGQMTKVRAHLADALVRGGTVLTGGSQRPDLGPLFHEPTVLADVPADARCVTEETFGPVVTVAVVHDDREVIAEINQGGYGLNASVWIRDLHRARSLACSLRVGMVTINDGYACTWGSVSAPIGGMKDSGLGRRHGAEGLLTYTESQVVAAQRFTHQGVGLQALYGAKAERMAERSVRALRVLKAVGWQ